tara:strand:+ start:508 stop:1044 length:537 start_codon:yes stop_codon:yes gene_type:complete
MEEQVILVDNSDLEIGVMGKSLAHELGELHRAISVFLFNKKGELLLQKRASSKYHSGGLWTNTCCSHPRPGEENLDAATRRLKEEMGISADLFNIFSFTYKAPFENGLVENEYDHVFIGSSEYLPKLNSQEAEDFKFISISDVIANMEQKPKIYTEWFKIAIYKVDQYIKNDSENKNS